MTLDDRLAQLPPAAPDDTRAARTRARCHATLAHGHPAARRGKLPASRRQQQVMFVLLGGFSLVYLFAIAHFAHTVSPGW